MAPSRIEGALKRGESGQILSEWCHKISGLDAVCQFRKDCKNKMEKTGYLLPVGGEKYTYKQKGQKEGCIKRYSL